MSSFIPEKYQDSLNEAHLIKKNATLNEEHVPMDVVFVGAGPAGLAGAIELAKLVKNDDELQDIEIGVLEKAESLGGHNLSGAVINPRSLKELFPELNESDFPFKNKITQEKVTYLTETSSIPLPTPPTMKNHGNYSVSICELVRWLGEKAENLGINIFTNFPADSLLTNENQVIGVRTTPMGLNRDNTEGAQYMPGTDIAAHITVLTEGTRGSLTQAYTQWQNISAEREQLYALGVKELWKVKKPLKEILHTMGWPLKNEFGGSWMYPMGEDHVSLGLVVGLDYKNAKLDVHHMLQQLKKHPTFASVLEGGELVEWGAKTIPEGGYHSIPKQLSGDGVILAGDCAGFVNVPALKGIHYAIQSGIYAARACYKALKAKSYQQKDLAHYEELVRQSYIFDDLKKVRNMRQAFKGGFLSGAIKAGLMTLTNGNFPSVSGVNHSDAKDPKTSNQAATSEGKLSKVDAVYLSGNKTRDDIPPHLTATKDIPESVAQFYAHLCPAGVYEVKEGQLVINAPNCVDCKATDVLGPRWLPREGGSGPSYQNM